MQIQIDLRDVAKVQKNIDALKWAIAHCPVAFLAPLMDTKALYEHIREEYTEDGALEKRLRERAKMRIAVAKRAADTLSAADSGE